MLPRILLLWLVLTPAALLAQTKVGLQLFYERPEDEEFAVQEGQKLQELVSRLAPKIELDLYVTQAPTPKKQFIRVGPRAFLVPMQDATLPRYSALLLTRSPFGAQGYAGNMPARGVLSIPLMEAKTRAGGNSADITIHELLHTLVGRRLLGRTMPDPHSNDLNGFANATRVDPAGQDNWDEWYAWLLR